MAIRENSTVVDIYNDGTIVYLYDEGHRDRLHTMNAPTLVTGVDEREDADVLRIQVVEEKLMAAYELLEDHGLLVEVSVGKALSAREKKGRKWMRVQKTLIDLPSGRLRVESANSCSIQAGKPNDEGATVNIAPGEYLLSLFRVDPDEDDDEDEETDLSEVVVLTPIADTKPPKKWDPYLSWEQASGVAPLRLVAPRVENGIFHGSVLRERDLTITNLRAQTLRGMGVRFGDQLEIAFGGEVFRTLFSGHLSRHGLLRFFHLSPDTSECMPPVLATFLYHHRQRHMVLMLEELSDGALPSGEEPNPITVRLLGEPLLPHPEESLVGTAERLPGGKVKARVLLAGRRGVFVDLDAASLKHLHPGCAREFNMDHNGITRGVKVGPPALQERDALVRQVRRVAPENRKREKQLIEKAAALLEEYKKAESWAVGNKLFLRRESVLQELERLRVPEDLLPTMPLYGNLCGQLEDWQSGGLWLTPLIGGEFFMEFDVGDTLLLYRDP